MSKSQPVAREKPAETSVTAPSELGEALRYEDKLQASVDIADQADVVAYAAPGPDRESELAALVKAMQARLDQLEGRADEAYGDDDKLFIAKPNGENWVERQLDRASKSYVDVEMRATAFYGPFNTDEAVAAYLAAKRSKREDSYVAWENVRTVTGREKRRIEATERADRESMGQPAKLPGYFASGR